VRLLCSPLFSSEEVNQFTWVVPCSIRATNLEKLYSLLIPALGMMLCIGVGSLASGLLYDELDEHHPAQVGLLLVLALVAFAGAVFFLFRLLKRIAPKS
jgi:hypothetical protein